MRYRCGLTASLLPTWEDDEEEEEGKKKEWEELLILLKQTCSAEDLFLANDLLRAWSWKG